MTFSPLTADELQAVFRPARFRLSTYNDLLAQLPRLTSDRSSGLLEPHRAVIDAISRAHTSVNAEVHHPGAAEPELTQWYGNDDAVIECCLVDDEVVTLTWPDEDADDNTLFATRIAATIGFDEANAATLELPDGVEATRIALTEDLANELRWGERPIDVALDPHAAHLLGGLHRIVRLWSAIGGNPSGSDLAYGSTIVYTPHGPWLLDPGEEPSLRQLHPIDLWVEIGMLLTADDLDGDQHG